ncbi:hypothetical protein JRO89_XS02G0029700 [Xanthoceras sorbifolium]|uniref:Uncharacterized protein n=1 Tax=Xanthoceras sorbifolium TaxID=99658 RepID=A0ABQ8IEB2_9ROSI|nr:hypothetical protein JRO89_XS02G0029700 [Xanthoceras sorbifolium]
MHRLDVLDERSSREGGRRTPRRREGIGDSEEEEEEAQLGGVKCRELRMVQGQPRDTDVRRNSLDELTKRMKVEVPDFMGRLDPDAFYDWITALEDYFDWFAVPGDRKNHAWKRTNISHTRVEHGGKALNVIIDNGNSMNIIAKEVVKRLGLPQETHPMPYRTTTEVDGEVPAAVHTLLQDYSKLYARRARPFRILKKLGLNAYVEDLIEFQGDVVPLSSLPETPSRVPSLPRQPDTVADILDHQFVSTQRSGYCKFLIR